jgi:hypothetical protein
MYENIQEYVFPTNIWWKSWEDNKQIEYTCGNFNRNSRWTF